MAIAATLAAKWFKARILSSARPPYNTNDVGMAAFCLQQFNNLETTMSHRSLLESIFKHVPLTPVLITHTGGFKKNAVISKHNSAHRKQEDGSIQKY